MRGISLRDFQLSRSEFGELAEGAILKRRCQASGHKLDWQVMIMKGAGQREIIRDCTPPIVVNFAVLKCLAADRGRTTPTEVFLRLLSQGGSNRCIPD